MAETWFDSSKYFLGDMFDSTMNYIFRNAVLEYAARREGAADLVSQLEAVREAYPPQALPCIDEPAVERTTRRARCTSSAGTTTRKDAAVHRRVPDSACCWPCSCR